MTNKITVKSFEIQNLLELSPKDYYLKKALLLHSGPDWMALPFKTNFEQQVLISDENGNNFRTSTKLPFTSVTVDKNYDLLKLKFETDFENIKLKLISLIKDFLNIDKEDYKLNDHILNHFKNGVIVAKEVFVPNIQLMLEDLFNYLSNLPGEENIEHINQCQLLILAIRNIYTKNSFIYKPLFFTSKENNKYQKILRNLIKSKVLVKNRFNNNMMDYCLLIRSRYLVSNKNYHSLFVNFYKFFVTLGLEINNAYNKNQLFKQITKLERFMDLDIVYLNNDVNLSRDVVLMSFILTDIEFEGSKFELPYWTNRLFGKGFKLFLNNEFAVDGEGRQPNPKYDIVKFIKEFNKMIDDRMKLNQKFHN